MKLRTATAVLVPLTILLALLASTAPAAAASLRLTHPYGELIDRDPVIAHLNASFPDRIDCRIAPAVTRAGATITITTQRFPPGTTPTICTLPDQVSLGELSVGWWTVVLRILDADGTTVVDRYEREWRIHPPDTLCGQHASLRGSVFVDHVTLSVAQLADRIGRDPAFAARLLNPVEVQSAGASGVLYYSPLDNPYDVRAALQATGEFRSVGANGLACFSAPPPDSFGDVVEFFHEALGHYFYASDPAEAAGLDSGTGARGWARTGKQFHVLVQPGCPLDRIEQAAYRFFGKPGVGPSSHVFTVDRAECRIVDRSGAWLYEGTPFWATPANSSGGCTIAGEAPLYRVWKPFGESNHRFTTELAVVAEMEAKGWVNEGVAMCVKRKR